MEQRQKELEILSHIQYKNIYNMGMVTAVLNLAINSLKVSLSIINDNFLNISSISLAISAIAGIVLLKTIDIKSEQNIEFIQEQGGKSR